MHDQHHRKSERRGAPRDPMGDALRDADMALRWTAAGFLKLKRPSGKSAVWRTLDSCRCLQRSTEKIR